MQIQKMEMFMPSAKRYKENSVATRFLLIRSFDSNNLKKLLTQHNISFSGGKEKELMKITYHSCISINELLDYIEKKDLN